MKSTGGRVLIKLCSLASKREKESSDVEESPVSQTKETRALGFELRIKSSLSRIK